TQHGRGTFILDAPSGRDLQRLRQQQIRSLSEHYVEEAQKLGFEPDEVRSLIEEHIRSWERNRN
ncbi:MAG: hypothetical protein KIT29_06600, partial [Anaerolineales bacterium]|nr:hypothetical protein [Anaerolineales bacterium]